MTTRLEQHGDVVLEIPVGPRSPNIVQRPVRAPESIALTALAALIFLAATWFWKVEVDHQAGQLLMLPVFVLNTISARWVTDELWRKPEDPAARATYQRGERIRGLLGFAILAAILAALFLAPDRSIVWWTPFPVLMALSVALWWWTQRTQDRWLERVPAS